MHLQTHFDTHPGAVPNSTQLTNTKSVGDGWFDKTGLTVNTVCIHSYSMVVDGSFLPVMQIFQWVLDHNV